MNVFLAHFQSFPSSAKNGIILLIAAWGWLLFSIYWYLLPGEIPDRVLVGGIMACTLIFKARNWARVLCILGNVLAILVHIQFAIHFLTIGISIQGIVCVITIALFTVSTVFLALPQTAEFYKKHTPDPSLAADGKNDSEEN